VCLQVKLCDPHLSALKVRFSRRGAIQIYVYLYLYPVSSANRHTDGNEGKMLTFGNCFVKVLEERSESSTVVHDEHGAVCQAVSAVDGHF